jgi:endonuclease YncB( thermonuclease family)
MKKCFLLIFLLLISPVFAQDFTNVKYLNNYDGDTVTFDLGSDLPNLFRYIPVRLYGVDTPEIKSGNPTAFIAKDFVKNEMINAHKINLTNCKGDKYFRIDCKVIYDSKDLTSELLKRNYGYEYYGGKKWQ